MKKLYYLSLVAIAFAFSTCGKDEKKSADRMAGEVPPIEVATPTVDSLTIRRTYPAYLKACKSLDIVARVNGYITSKNFNDGDRVHKGQLLFTIEDTSYRDAVQQAEASLASARSQADYATRQHAAMKKALESDAVSQMDVIQAENAMNNANAAVKNAQAALETARTNLGYCTVRALADGHIQAPTVIVGNYVSGAAAPITLTTIYDDSSLDALFSITDADYLEMLDNFGKDSSVFKDVPVEFTQELPHSYSGYVSYIAPDINESTGTMVVKVTIANPYGELKDGQYAQVHLPMMTDPRAILVRDASISTDQKGKYLYTVNDSNRVVYTPIEVGELYQDTLRIVTQGITPDTRYVTKALLKVRNGMEVKPISAKK